jgi:preprotein translocase YajC subunit
LRPKAGGKEQREQLERLKNLKKNDRVVTTSGIHGIVSNINIEAGTITLRVDENSNAKLTIDRMSIRTVSS